MKKIIITLLLSTACVSFGQDKTKTKEKEETQDHIMMHEQMAKAHQDAVTCLKSGKSDEECRMAFREMCKESGGPEMCGSMSPMRMHGKKGKK